MSFTERTPHERGFARIYEVRVIPALTELTARHRQLEVRRKRRMRYLAGLALVAAAVVTAAGFGAFLQVSGLWAAALITVSWVALLLSIPGLLIVWGRSATAGDDAARRCLLPIVAEHLELTYDREADEPPDPAPFLERGLITRASFGRFDDAMTAHVGGVTVTMLRADFANPGNTSAADWQGLILKAELPTPAPASIRIGGDEAWRLADGFASLSKLPDAALGVAADAPEATATWMPSAITGCIERMWQRFDPDDTGRFRAMIDGARLRLSIRDPASSPLPMPDPTATPDEIEAQLHKLIADAALPLDIARAFEGTHS